MGFFSKLKFWKKKDSLDFDSLASKEFSGSAFPDQEMLGKAPEFNDPMVGRRSESLGQYTPPTSALPQQGSVGEGRDLELISSKLDTIKALLTSMEQRLANVEKSLGSQQKPPQRLW